MNQAAWRDVISGQQAAVRWQAGRVVTVAGTPAWLLAGSFNPRHRGHDEMAAWVRRRHGQVVEYEISVTNVDKPTLREAEVARRLSQFGAEQPVWITRAATFAEKARLFPGVTFLVGADTIVRVADPRYYPDGVTGLRRVVDQLGEAGCRFLVFGRLIQNRFCSLRRLDLPESLGGICQEVSHGDFREDISSSQLRGGTETRGPRPGVAGR